MSECQRLTEDLKMSQKMSKYQCSGQDRRQRTGQD